MVNQYTTVGGTTRTHDANGNLSDDGTQLYEFDFQNRLVRVTNKATMAVIATYRYDALGRRVEKAVNGGATTRYLLEGVQVVEEYDNQGTWQARYVYEDGIDQPRAMDRADQADVNGNQNTAEVLRFHYHQQALGCVTEMTQPTGAVVEWVVYDVYGAATIRDQNGNVVGSSPIGNPYLYTGREYDAESGLYFYRARAYDPVTGRFLQRDPLGYVDGLGLYQYARSAPSVRIDPLGWEAEEASPLEEALLAYVDAIQKKRQAADVEAQLAAKLQRIEDLTKKWNDLHSKACRNGLLSGYYRARMAGIMTQIQALWDQVAALHTRHVQTGSVAYWDAQVDDARDAVVAAGGGDPEHSTSTRGRLYSHGGHLDPRPKNGQDFTFHWNAERGVGFAIGERGGALNHVALLTLDRPPVRRGGTTHYRGSITTLYEEPGIGYPGSTFELRVNEEGWYSDWGVPSFDRDWTGAAETELAGSSHADNDDPNSPVPWVGTIKHTTPAYLPDR